MDIFKAVIQKTELMIHFSLIEMHLQIISQLQNIYVKVLFIPSCFISC